MDEELTPSQYLIAVLREHSISRDSPEVERIRAVREDIRTILRSEYGSVPTLNEGGSKAKGTMIRDSYDLDLFCHFPEGDSTAGQSLEAIYHDVYATLSGEFFVEPGRSALKVHTRESSEDIVTRGPYLHVDVVPGRFIRDGEGAVNLFQNGGEKSSLKTNPAVHISHIRDSGVRKAIRLAKLWNHRWNLSVKTFALELLVVKVLQDHSGEPLPEQLLRLWEELRENASTLSVEDPANPQGNDLSEILNLSTRSRIQGAAEQALSVVSTFGWGNVFGPLAEISPREKAAALGAVTERISAGRPTRPYFDGCSVVSR